MVIKKFRTIKKKDYKKFIVFGIVLKIVSFILFSSILSGCNSFDKVQIGEIQEVKVNGITGQNIFLEFKVPIENLSKLNIKISEVNIKAKVNGTYIGKVSNIEKMKITKKSNNVYSVKMKLKVAGLFGALNTLKILKNNNSAEVTLDGSIRAKFFGLNKKIAISEKQTVDLSNFKNSLM